MKLIIIVITKIPVNGSLKECFKNEGLIKKFLYFNKVSLTYFTQKIIKKANLYTTELKTKTIMKKVENKLKLFRLT